MEKGMRHLARYICGDNLYVDVICEDTGRPVDQDYWLCDTGSDCRRFMFSRTFRSEKQEIEMIRDYVKSYRKSTHSMTK